MAVQVKELPPKLDLENISKAQIMRDLISQFNEILPLVALISIARLRQEFYGLPRDDKIFFNRVAKEAVHELGHTCGLTHCSNPKCVMFFSNSLLDTDRKGPSFRERCLRKIER